MTRKTSFLDIVIYPILVRNRLTVLCHLTAFRVVTVVVDRTQVCEENQQAGREEAKWKFQTLRVKKKKSRSADA